MDKNVAEKLLSALKQSMDSNSPITTKQKNGELELLIENHEISEEIFLKLVIRINPEKDLMKVFLYFDEMMSISEKRVKDAAYLLNEMNQCIQVGSLELLSEPTGIRYKDVVNCAGVEDSDVLFTILSNLVSEASDVFAYTDRVKALCKLSSKDKIETVVDQFFNSPEEWGPVIFAGRMIC